MGEILIAIAAFRMKQFDLVLWHYINFHVPFLVYIPVRWKKQIREIKSSHAPLQYKCAPPDMRMTCSPSQIWIHSRGPRIFLDNGRRILQGSRHIGHHFCTGSDDRWLSSSHKVGLQDRQHDTAALSPDCGKYIYFHKLWRVWELPITECAHIH